MNIISKSKVLNVLREQLGNVSKDCEIGIEFAEYVIKSDYGFIINRKNILADLDDMPIDSVFTPGVNKACSLIEQL